MNETACVHCQDSVDVTFLKESCIYLNDATVLRDNVPLCFVVCILLMILN